MELEQALAEIKTLRQKVDQLETDNFNCREKRREVERERDQLREQVPGEDQAVVPAADAELLAGYKELGEPSDVKQRLEAAAETEQEAAKVLRRERIREAAGKDYNARALEKFLPVDAELEKQGEGDEAAWVVKQGETAKPLSEVVKAIEEELDLSLAASEGRANLGAGSNPGEPAYKGKNPWKRETLNLTEQARISRENPALAKRLMAEAENS